MKFKDLHYLALRKIIRVTERSFVCNIIHAGNNLCYTDAKYNTVSTTIGRIKINGF